MKNVKYNVARADSLTKRKCMERVRTFRKLAEKLTGEKHRRALKMAAWYKHRAKA